MRRIGVVGAAAALLLVTHGPTAEAQRRRAPVRAPQQLNIRAWTTSVSVALGRQLAPHQVYALDAGGRRGRLNRSAIQFSRWAHIFGRIRARTPGKFPAAQRQAYKELMMRLKRDRHVDPWKTVARILPRVMKQRRARPAPVGTKVAPGPRARPGAPRIPAPQPPRGLTVGPRALVGRWMIGSASMFSLYNPRTGAWRDSGSSGTALILDAKGRYIRVMKTHFTRGTGGHSAVYTQGRYVVRGNTITFKPTKIRGYTKMGGPRKPIKPSYKVKTERWAIQSAAGGEYLQIGRYTRLRRVSHRP